MTNPQDPDDDEKAPPSGVDRLLDRFGPVPARDPDRAPPGPKRPTESVGRPRPQPVAEQVVAVPTSPQPSPLFDEPHDDVFGDARPQTVEASPADTVFAEIEPLEPALDPIEVIDRRDWARMPRRTGPMFRFLVLAFVIALGASAAYGRVTTWFDEQIDPPGEPGAPVEFAIPAGSTANDVTQNLYSEGVIANPTIFRYWLGDNFDGEFQAGDYSCVRGNMSFDEVLACLDGEGPLPPQFFSITIPEGFRLDELLRALNRENPSYTIDELERDVQATLVSVGLTGVPERALPNSPDPTGSGKEGLLFPATYQIDEKKGSDTLDILIRMADTMEQKYEGAVAELGRDLVIEELELTDYDVLIVASLVEEEARVAEDRPKIARVIYNRLVRNWSLGIDATACYAAQKSCADLTIQDLESDSPWNTRNVNSRGLPPTPIAAPGEAAIRAALSPEVGPWMYYVLTESDGSHTFAETEAEFAAAKQLCQERDLC